MPINLNSAKEPERCCLKVQKWFSLTSSNPEVDLIPRLPASGLVGIAVDDISLASLLTAHHSEEKILII